MKKATHINMRFKIAFFFLVFCNLSLAFNLDYIQYMQAKARDKIYGGVEASRGEFPFMVAVVLDNAALCGGSLISSTTILTAAQCLNPSFESVMVHLGVHNLTDDTELGRLILKAREIIIHEEYNELNLDNDLGLIKLPISVEASNILPVALPSRSFAEGNSFENYSSRIFGWGITPESKNFTEILRTAESIVISNEICEDRYTLLPYVTPLKLCLDNAGHTGACLGDAGGPVVIYRPEDGKYVQIGAISFAAGKCGYNLPVIVSRLSAFLDWIQFNAGVVIED